jgi:aldose 1-epimerase
MTPSSATGRGPVVLRAGDARATVEPLHGGRVGSLIIDGTEVLWTGDRHDPVLWGSYPMVPFAGRIDRGRFTFDDIDAELPINQSPHAIHGMGFDRPWTVTRSSPTDVELGIELDDRWPFGGRVTQRIELATTSLRCELTVESDRPMPVVVGWHPWFRRPLTYRFGASGFYPRNDDGIPNGDITRPPGRGSWDDCFCDIDQSPSVTVEGAPTITITSSCDHLVVYDMPHHAVCIEPQSGPPNAVNLSGRSAAETVEPGHPLRHWMLWTW